MPLPRRCPLRRREREKEMSRESLGGCKPHEIQGFEKQRRRRMRAPQPMPKEEEEEAIAGIRLAVGG